VNRNLKLGLGIGCGVVAVLFLLLLGGGVWFAREMGREYKTVQETEAALVAAHGDLETWTPPPGLVPAAERVAAFVGVREGLAEWRARLATAAGRFASAREEGGGVRGLWNQMRAGSDLGLDFAGFCTARNRLLLDAGMGPAEYAWLYGLVYYAWLGEDPGAGAGALQLQRGGGVRVTVDTGDHDDPVRQARLRMRALLEPLFARAEPGPPGTVGAGELASERVLLEDDPLRIPWQDGPPQAVADALTPHRAVLASAWLAAVNPVELLFDLGAHGESADRN